MSICLLIILFSGMINYGQDTDTETISRSRQRALEKMEPAINNLISHMEDPNIPSSIRALVKTALNNTEELLEKDTITYDHDWKAYHEQMNILYHQLKEEKADNTILKNIRILKNASTVESFLLAIIGISTVFTGLLILAGIFVLIPKIFNPRAKQIKEKDTETSPLTGEIISAISVALYLHLQVYQEEQKQILTWDRKFRRFSPWNMSGRLFINQKNTITKYKG